MTTDELYAELARAALRKNPSDASGLALMLVLHTHAIALKPEVRLDDVHSPAPIVLPAITERHAASVVATLWETDDERSRYEYWHHVFQEAPYQVLSSVPSDWRNRMRALLEKIQASPCVDRLLEDA